jgi:site-specific DNA-methyltransferase (adenine-specific)
MLDGAFTNAVASCTAGAAWYVAAPPGPLHLLFAGAMKVRGILRQMLIWVKNNSTFSPLGVSYHWRHEPIFYGWLPDGGHRYHGDRKQDTVWEVDRPQASPDHPTMKPVELVARAIEHSSLAGELVYDPFLGSGTTLIAAHRLGRKAYGCELEPKYADVILRRAEAEGLDVRKEG